MPFDFDGVRLVYMDFLSNKKRSLMIYYANTREVKEVQRFNGQTPVISHVKLAKNKNGEEILIYVQGGKSIVSYHIDSLKTKLIATMPDNILALHVR